MGLRWEDFDLESGTLLVQRSVVHGRFDAVKTEYSQDLMPLHSSHRRIKIRIGDVPPHARLRVRIMCS